MGDTSPVPDSTNTEGPPQSPKVEAPSSGNNPLEVTDNQPTKQASETPGTSDKNKIEVIFKHVGNAPILKKSKWAVSPTTTVSGCVGFIRKYMNLDPNLSIFIYVNQSFAPAVDQTIQNLLDCYETDKKLILYYATTPAWG